MDAPEACQNPECTHDEPNLVYTCPVCKSQSLIVRKVLTLPGGSVIAYDPFCGITIHA